ncbi:hypothetical protein EDS67_04585 [candidate division KSB1 bacterium]|nr:MAG: hypothetical protein EDS67_04585 [candidate division KSB1 bacterium]MBC6948894.1 hypothetical protein [candidate division KSB1 bacterium]MCE7940549.1 hypothetical protein [Chlorobi bacterium CHB1]
MFCAPVRSFCFISGFLALSLAGCQKNQESAEEKDGADATASAHNGSYEIVINDNNGEDYNPVIDPANFVAAIDNPYFNLTPGRVWVYEGKDEDGKTERVEVEVTNETKTILGVNTTVVHAREWVEGELVEDTFDWFAQDKDGNVWYFGEDSKEIEDGEVVNTNGSWEAGVNGAKPGIVMKANPQVNEAYRQEFLPGEAVDMGQVLSLNESVTIGLGTYADCLQTKDWTPLEPEVVEHKFYSKDVGNAILEKKVAGEAGQLELVEMRMLETQTPESEEQSLEN